jgi:hypothetical protein
MSRTRVTQLALSLLSSLGVLTAGVSGARAADAPAATEVTAPAPIPAPQPPPPQPPAATGPAEQAPAGTQESPIPPGVEGTAVPSAGGGYCYGGQHPAPGGGWEAVQTPHVHNYPPFDMRLFSYRDGCYYFIGDPRDFGYTGQTYSYYGAHPVADVYGGGWCFMIGPHTHWWRPWSPYFTVVGPWNYWYGPYDPFFWAYWPYFSFYYRSYYPSYYAGGRYYRNGYRTAPAISHVPPTNWRGSPPGSAAGGAWRGSPGTTTQMSPLRAAPAYGTPGAGFHGAPGAPNGGWHAAPGSAGGWHPPAGGGWHPPAAGGGWHPAPSGGGWHPAPSGGGWHPAPSGGGWHGGSVPHIGGGGGGGHFHGGRR